MGLEFLYSMGLVKAGNSQNPHASVVVQLEWDKFIQEEKLANIMEAVNRTSVSRTRYYFVNYGQKDRLFHRPIDQFNGRMSKPLKGAANLATRQRKFHKQLSNMLLSLRSADQQYAMKSSAEEVIFSSDYEAELEDTKPSPVAAFEET